MSVANYANELLQLWEKGCEKAIPLEFENKAKAMRFRFRMNSLRKDMRKENHHLLPFAEKCMLKLRDNIVILCPVDDNFAEVIRRAGLNLDEEPMGDEPEVETERPSGSQVAVEKFKKEQE